MLPRSSSRLDQMPREAARRSAPSENGPAAGDPGECSEGPDTQHKQFASKVNTNLVKQVWTKDEASRKIQIKYRQFKAKKQLEKLKKEKQDYEEMMEMIEREAYVKIVKMQQAEAEKKKLKEEEEKKRKWEGNQQKKRVLEAAFDGDIGEIKTVLKEVSDLDGKNGIGNDLLGKVKRVKHQLAVVDCEDPNNNTPLSEAASGGHPDIIKFLIDNGANVNSQGQFLRTPLYRAAFAGHLQACQVLLQNGADPRIYANDGQTPERVASVEVVVQLLQEWDISQTEFMMEKLEKIKQQQIDNDKKIQEAEKIKKEGEISQLKREYESKQKQLNQANCEVEKRIKEHDTAVASGYDRPDITLQTVLDAKMNLQFIQMETEQARDKLTKGKLKLHEKQFEGQDYMGEDDFPGLKVLLKDLDDILMHDIGNKIHKSGKWPLIIDHSGQAATFLRYRDTNYLNALNPAQMKPEKIRLALLGAIRYGKPLVLDMMGIDIFDTCAMHFDDIQTDLLKNIMNKSILKMQKYLSLVKDTDGEEYSWTAFSNLRVQNFKFFIVTENPFPSKSLTENTYPIRIIIAEKYLNI